MKKLNDLTQEYLKECVTYDPETGSFAWNERPIHHFKDSEKQKWQTKEIIHKNWNNRYANKLSGNLSPINYITIRMNNKSYLAHRLAWLYMEGYFPEYCIDHKNKNRSDNRWSNLRHVTHQCNMQNTKIRSDNTSGITGVSVVKVTNPKTWSVGIEISGKYKHIGTFNNINDAAMARYDEEQNNPSWPCAIESSAKKYLKERNLI